MTLHDPGTESVAVRPLRVGVNSLHLTQSPPQGPTCRYWPTLCQVSRVDPTPECIRQGTEFLLAGSIRDDGPLPEVVTDAVEAKKRMREMLHGATFCLMIATTLHSVAVGNLLPAWVKVVCVDINPSTAIKLTDRGTFQTVGLVTDVAPFLRALVEELSAIEAAETGARS